LGQKLLLRASQWFATALDEEKMAVAASSGLCSASTKKITCSFVHRKLQEM
jgi:hypothetical protein